jgi:hypothetical protein
MQKNIVEPTRIGRANMIKGSGAFLLLLFAGLTGIQAADILKLPRQYGPLGLTMTTKEFTRVTGVEPGGCEDCVPDQHVAELDASYFAKTLEAFPGVAKGATTEPAAPTVFFYRDKLEFLAFSIKGYDYDLVKRAVEGVLGAPHKREVFAKRCIYAGGETFSWSDSATVVTLTEYRDNGENELELKFADKRLLQDAELLQEFAQRDVIKDLEKENHCR